MYSVIWNHYGWIQGYGWDIGALFGLIKFNADFVDFVECDIPVKDITKFGRVIEMLCARVRDGLKQYQ